VTDVILHALADGAQYDLRSRRPQPLPAVKPPQIGKLGVAVAPLAADDEPLP
jgi:hypothetical protein